MNLHCKSRRRNLRRSFAVFNRTNFYATAFFGLTSSCPSRRPWLFLPPDASPPLRAWHPTWPECARGHARALFPLSLSCLCSSPLSAWALLLSRKASAKSSPALPASCLCHSTASRTPAPPPSQTSAPPASPAASARRRSEECPPATAATCASTRVSSIAPPNSATPPADTPASPPAPFPEI